MAVCRRFPCPEMKPVFDLRLISLLLLEALIKFCLFTEAFCVLVLVTGTVLYDHVVSIQAHRPTTNITLIHRIGFQPGKGTIIHTQLEGSTPQVGPVFFHENDHREHLRFWCAVLHLSITQDFTPVGYRTKNRSPVPLLLLVKYARYHNH